MSTGSKGWIRWAGGALAVALIVVIVGVVMRRPSPDSRVGSQATGSVAAGSGFSIQKWHDDTFAGKDLRKLWEQYSAAAQAELNKAGANPSDIKSKADALGADPQKVFDFMRDQVALDPYAGMLRGARGTLAAGAGNALDRALLAQELLKSGGIESRLIAGRLSEDQADVLLRRFRGATSLPAVLSEPTGTLDDATVDKEAAELAAKVSLTASQVKPLLESARQQGEQFRAKTEAQRAMHFDLLNGELKQRGLGKPADVSALATKLKERLRKHYWLQVREPDGTWSEFDPTFADAKRGTAYGSSPAPLAQVPDEEVHRLEFSLVYHYKKEGAPAQEVLVAGSFASATALFDPLQFRIQPVGTDAGAIAAMDVKQRIALLRQMKRFQGVLIEGSKLSAGRVFDLEGNTYDAGDRSLGPPGGTFFGDSLGGGEEPAPPEFVDLQVVMRLVGPGREPEQQTRTIVRAEDVLSPTFAPPLVEWEILLQPQWISREFVAFQTLNQTLATGNTVIGRPQAEALREASALPPTPPLFLMQMALLRQEATAKILGEQANVRAFIDEPLLTISGHRLSAIREQEGIIAGQRHIDIAENGIRYLAADNGAQAAAFEAALRQSVADCSIEDRVLRDSFAASVTTSAMSILEDAQGEKRPLQFGNAKDPEKLRSGGVTKVDAEWIRDNESPDALLLVASTSGGSDAWWSVRPDGNAILRTSGGQGQSLTEDLILTAKVAMAALCVFEITEVSNQAAAHGGVWSDVGAMKVAMCLIATGVGAMAYGGGAAAAAYGMHSTHFAIEMFSVFLLAVEAGFTAVTYSAH